jgi:hypothetical protein
MSRKTRLLASLALGVIASSGSARAFVAVRAAPRVAVGVAAGAVAGAAVASAATPTTTVVTPPPTVVTAPPPPAQSAPVPVGTVVTTLPSGCVSSGGRYQCGSSWYKEYFGANGVYYEAVAP